MQFKVPQFLEIEDKIFGPFTFKQFIYLAGGAGLCFVLYKLLGLLWAIIPILLVAGFAAALAFYRPNNKPFVEMLASALNFLLGDKLYIWERRKRDVKEIKKVEAEAAAERERMNQGAKFGGNKLRDLAWSLDVLDLNKHEKTGS